MKYRNAKDVLPPELMERIQQYAQGEYLYIPIKAKQEKKCATEYKVELQKRNGHIYTKALEGLSNKRISEIYNLSESSVRRIIINQKKGYQTMKARITDILMLWDIDNITITQVYDSAWQVGEDYILKVYDDIRSLEHNIRITTILDDMHIPVGTVIPTKEGFSFGQDGEKYYILTQKLPGSNVVSLKDNPDLAEEMGRSIARLHMAFQECEKQDEFWEKSLLAEMKGWIKSTLEESNWELVSERAFQQILVRLEAVYEYLPVQLIHRDVHFGNFLFEKGHLSGYIDFDLSQRNIRIFDLCYFMLGILSEEEKLDITKEEWFVILKNVFRGYQQLSSLTGYEVQAVPYVMESIELLCAAWFYKQKDMVCAKDAMKICEFVKNNEAKIWETLKLQISPQRCEPFALNGARVLD